MEEKDNLVNEFDKTKEDDSNTNESTKSEPTEKVSTGNSSTTTTAPVDPPPTTSSQGAGEIIKPTEGREKNPKKR